MNNYKIRVNNEAESREAQELFFALGYKNGVCTSGGYPATIVAVVESLHCDTPFYSRALSLNHDAHKDYIGLTLPQLHDLVAQSKLKEQALISGADALRALADGKEVEYLYGTQWESATGNQILISAFIGDKFKFRIKPQTIKIELEIPKPFLPKDGDMVWFISIDNTCGYSHDVFGHGLEEKWIQYGAWRTKEEIKIVVEQLRKLKEHSK